MAISPKVKNFTRLNRPLTQNFVVGCILFCAPGIYSAVIGLGAGGGRPSSGHIASMTNAILYGLFTLCGWFGGVALNILKPKVSFMIGSLGYPLYVSGLWYYDRTGHEWYPLWAGAMLGSLCGILWTAAAFIEFAYPQEKDKGLFISMQWMLRSVGATAGASISFGANVHQQKAVGVSNAVYGVFTAIHCLCAPIAFFFIIDPRKVIRDDGTHIALFKPTKVTKELKSMVKAFFDRRILILFPAMLVCEMALALISSINGFYFNLRTRSLNNLAFQSIQIFVPFVLIFILDNRRIQRRKVRGFIGLALMGTISIGACCGLFGWLKVYNVDKLAVSPAADWTDPDFAGLFIIYLMFGTIYSGYQMVVEWTTSALTNDPSQLAQFSGMFKGTSSLGMCLSFVIDAQKVDYVGQAAFQLALYILGICGMVYILIVHVKSTNYFTEENVIAPLKVEEQAKVQGLVTEEQIQAEYEKNRLASLATQRQIQDQEAQDQVQDQAQAQAQDQAQDQAKDQTQDQAKV